MSPETLVGVIAGLATVAAALLGAPRLGRDARTTILKDLEIYANLPEGSSARTELLSDIERRVRLIAGDSKKRRSPAQIALGIVLVVLALAVAFFMVMWGSWWWLVSPVVVFLLLLGAVGLWQGTRKESRDDKGNLVS